MEKNHYSHSSLLFLIHVTRPFYVLFFILVCTAFAWAVSMAYQAYLLKVILNLIAEKNGTATLTWQLLQYVSITVLVTTKFRFTGYLTEVVIIPKIRSTLLANSFAQLLDQTHQFHQSNLSGCLSNKMQDLASGTCSVLEFLMDRIIPHSFTIIISMITLYQVKSSFACMVTLWILCCVMVILYSTKHIIQRAHTWSEKNSHVVGSIVDAISNISSVLLCANRMGEARVLTATYTNAAQAEQSLQWGYLGLKSFFDYSFFIIQGLSLYLLMQGWLSNTLTVGDFSLVFALNLSILNAIWRMTLTFPECADALGKISQALATLHAPQDRYRPTKQLQVTQGEIVFKKVTFHYEGAPTLFEKESIVIPAQQKVGLVGCSGQGKSTFVNLILNLYNPEEGKIFIDGQDLYHVTEESIHDAIGLIPQDVSLFHRTILENIAYGKKNATNEECITASRKAHADDFIQQLPHGYQTEAGERGLKLSGGQRQRIALARAFLKNAPILILDEATSSLDSITEQNIQNTLKEFMQGKTTLVIAHRLSTLLDMDRILVFEQGSIVADGTHQELIAQGGMYANLWKAHSGATVPYDTVCSSTKIKD